MTDKTKNILDYVLFIIGLVLIIGGIITHKFGAGIVALIISAVTIQPMIKKNNILSLDLMRY
jgi:hypothetical protein